MANILAVRTSSIIRFSDAIVPIFRKKCNKASPNKWATRAKCTWSLVNAVRRLLRWTVAPTSPPTMTSGRRVTSSPTAVAQRCFSPQLFPVPVERSSSSSSRVMMGYRWAVVSVDWQGFSASKRRRQCAQLSWQRCCDVIVDSISGEIRRLSTSVAKKNVKHEQTCLAHVHNVPSHFSCTLSTAERHVFTIPASFLCHRLKTPPVRRSFPDF